MHTHFWKVWVVSLSSEKFFLVLNDTCWFSQGTLASSETKSGLTNFFSINSIIYLAKFLIEMVFLTLKSRQFHYFKFNRCSCMCDIGHESLPELWTLTKWIFIVKTKWSRSCSMIPYCAMLSCLTWRYNNISLGWFAV